MKKIGYVTALAAFLLAAPALAAPPAVVRESVAICDPNNPTNCLAPGSNGTLPSGGSSAPGTATTTNSSGTIASANTFQQVLAQNSARKGCLIQNPTTATEPLFVYFGSGTPTPSTVNSLSLSPGSSASCWNGAYILSDAVQVAAATAGHAFFLNAQ